MRAKKAPVDCHMTGQPWSVHDYVSPGLQVVRPDAAFPKMCAGDHLNHPWKYLRRDVPHTWYVDERFPLMGFLNRDEAVLLHNVARQFAGRHVLEVGGWLGWSTCHLALAGARVDSIDPAHDDLELRAIVEESVAACGVSDLVHLAGGSSPDKVATLGSDLGRRWSLFFIDGAHERPGPARDALACLPWATDDCAFMFHDLASPDVAEGLRVLAGEGFEVLMYQTAQIMGLAWRGDVVPVAHVPDPDVAWQIPAHLGDLPVSGVDFTPRARSHHELRPAPVAFPELRTIADRDVEPTPAPSVCVVSNEVIGLFQNGGVGTSMTGLAETLTAEGLKVTILYTGSVWKQDVAVEPWRARYAELGIALVALGMGDMRSVVGPVRDRGFAVPFLVYRYLSAHPFDVVHFNDCCGDGSLSLAAKKLGVAFQESLFVTALHSPSQWVLECNQVLPTSLLLAAYNYAERLSVRCADIVWSPSRYMLDWARDHAFELPDQTFRHQYSIPSPRLMDGTAGAASFPEVRHGRARPPTEIVFFGRLEERKGLRLFCNAVHLLADELAARGVSITFMGKAQLCAGMGALEYIARRSSEWPVRVNTLTDLGQPEALQYLRRGDKLAVMPSPADNSPCTVYEALCWGIPFLAARTGGIPELVDVDDHRHVLFDDRTASLRDALRAAVEQGGWIARAAVSQLETRRGFVAMHERWQSLRPAPRPTNEPSRWAAAVIDHRAGADLQATVDSLATCPWFRCVVVLDRAGGTALDGVTTVDLLRDDPEAFARQLEAMAEDDVLLIHSGVSIHAEPMARMLGALDTPSVDGLLPVAEVVDAVDLTRLAPPLGGSPSFSLFEGVTFTGALLVRRRALMAGLRAHALAPESPFMGLADFCVAGGSSIWPYPETVLRRPAHLKLEVRSPLPARVAAYGGSSDVDRYYMLAAGYGSANGTASVSRGRDAVLALLDLGLTPGGVRLASLALRYVRRTRARVGNTAVGRAARLVRHR